MPTQRQINAFTLAFHLRAIRRLALEPGLINQAQNTLLRWQQQRGKTASDPYLQRWQSLLQGDLQVLQDTVCDDGDEAATLRNVSPLGFLLPPGERQALRLQSLT